MRRVIVSSVLLIMFLLNVVVAQQTLKAGDADGNQQRSKARIINSLADSIEDSSNGSVDLYGKISDRLMPVTPFTMHSMDDELVIVNWNRDRIRNVARKNERLKILDFPLRTNLSVDLDIRPFSITSDKTRVVIGRKGQPDIPFNYDATEISFFRGRVKDRPGSSVFLALGPRSSTGYVDLGTGEPRYLISSKDHNGKPFATNQISVFKAVHDGSNPYPAVPKCGLDGSTINIKEIVDKGIKDSPPAAIAAATVLQKGLKHFELAIETDYDYYILFNDPDAATDYVIEAFAAISDIYIRDVNAYFEVVYIRLWDQPDDLFNSSDPLSEMNAYWEANEGKIARDSAFFFSGRRDLAYGGIAFLNALCTNLGYGVSGYILGYFPDPTLPSPYQWDIGVTAHELGHNSGTGHTQNNGIDQCHDPATIPQRGTIMSYCSQTWSGGNALEDNYFHTIIQQNIESYMGSTSCYNVDCNMNQISDAVDIFGGSSLDTNTNNIPDECEDCNDNGVLDPVDIAGPTSQDLNNNDIPDECEPDCNNNGVPDDRDILLNTSTDAYGNGVPDECEEDCNNNGTSDYTEIQLDITLDIDRDAKLDSCQDCDSDSILDQTELSGAHNVWAARGTASTPITEFHGVVGVQMNESTGGAGSLVDQAQDLMITPTGKVLVSSGGDDRVLEFDLSGNYVGNFVSPGSGGLSYPTGLFLSNGKLLVASRDTNSVIAYSDVDGTLIGDFIAANSGGLSQPFGITRGPDSQIYVTSQTNEVLVYNSVTGSYVGAFVTSSNNGGLDQPRGLVFKPDGNLLISSYGTNEVLEFEEFTGKPLGKWAQVGTTTVLNQVSPWGIRIGPNGGVYVIRTGDAFGSSGEEGSHHDHILDHHTSESHLTKARIYEYDVRNGYLVRAFLAGSDFGLSFPTAFDFVPGWAIDCNFNMLQDSCDIASGFSLDLNTNGVPDECEIDCNSNGTQDRLDIIPYGDRYDCNSNLIPDECDLTALTSTDCNSNGVPDECDPDCNVNGIVDECDITDETSVDCTGNGIPDECEQDCNNNATADSCDILANTSNDCNLNEIPDECEPDCNTNSIPDVCDITDNTSDDCNEDGVPDECQLSNPPDTKEYLIEASDLVNVPNGCGSGHYNCGGVIGFNWQDTTTGTVLSADVTFSMAINCNSLGIVYGIRLNGVEVDTIQSTSSHCSCSGSSNNLFTLTLPTEHYVPGALNLLEITGSTDCLGFYQNVAVGGEYAKVTTSLVGDCNNTGTPDDCDIADGTSSDCNFNGLPDDCEGLSCVGACCDGISCSNNVTNPDCDVLGGTWFFEQTCLEVDCSGSCCTSGGCIENISQPDCQTQSGTWNGGEVCENSLCNLTCELATGFICQDTIVIDNSNINNTPSPSYSCGINTNHEGTLWYKFVALTDVATLATCNSLQTNSTFAFYENSCGTLNQIGCSEDECGAGNNLGEVTVTNLTPGNTYYIQFSAWSAADRGSYTLELDCGCSPPDTILPELAPIAKSRYLSMDPDVPSNVGLDIAIRVTLQQLDGFGGFNNQVRWVGPPVEYQEGSTPTPTFLGAPLQCTPHYQDWTGVELMHVYGDAVVPSSDYQIQTILEECDINNELSFSSVLPVSTGKWGDIITPFEGEGSTQPSIPDILSLVDKWLGNVEPIKARTQLRPNIPDPTQNVGIAEVLLGVDAWLGVLYPFDGPSVCP